MTRQPATAWRPHPLWLRITLSSNFSAAQVQDWHQRLQVHLKRQGLMAAISPTRLAIWRTGEELGSFDRGLVMGWLIAQTEVVLVRIERQAEAYAALHACTRTLLSLEDQHD